MLKAEKLLQGRPQRLYILDYGLFKVHANGNPRVIGICGFLIETDRGERVVIDTGLPAKYADDSAAASAEDGLGSFGEVLELTQENLPLAQLRKVGVGEDDIDLFITSHTHIDHMGGLHLFPRAPLVMAAAERRLDRPLYFGSARPVAWPEREYRLIEDDACIGGGFEVLLVPGHSPGQLAFVLELPQSGTVLLASDAISRPSELEERFAGAFDAPLALAQAERLMHLADERNAFVVFGHSPEQWPSLKKAPQFYG